MARDGAAGERAGLVRATEQAREAQPVADLGAHNGPNRRIRPVLRQRPGRAETPAPIAAPAADLDHRCPRGDLAQRDDIGRHQA